MELLLQTFNPAVRARDYARIAEVLRVFDVNSDHRLQFYSFIMEAVTFGDLRTIQMVLDAGADPNGTGSDVPIHTALFRAERNPEVLLELIAKGARVDAIDVYGRTPLMMALNENAPTAIRILLEHGANVNHVDNFRANVIDMAIKFSTVANVLELIRRGAIFDANRRYLMGMIENYHRGHRLTIENILERILPKRIEMMRFLLWNEGDFSFLSPYNLAKLVLRVFPDMDYPPDIAAYLSLPNMHHEKLLPDGYPVIHHIVKTDIAGNYRYVLQNTLRHIAMRTLLEHDALPDVYPEAWNRLIVPKRKFHMYC